MLAATTFNLACAGQSDANGITFSEKKKYETVFRVDLELGKWCEDDCKQVEDIARIEPTRIVLRDISHGDYPLVYHDTEYLDRETAEHHRFVSNKQGRNPFDMTWKGKCTLGEFTGFGGERNLF